ncbi:PREDICTED: uncharacterized protein LOC109160141 isoform X2 [Ipomoea nil]|uniref:uncharacterized protein LOC109160141 isoform X2 n=1 Tax=Ipomoea nil TaxID=35883 RepID=UPI0009011E0E|nr:PREDICTED: uncharacterized protein LOC109160141 isoform X2 [Ipomoea nil]
MSGGYRQPFPNPSSLSNSGCNGVCMVSNTWRDEQHPSFINFISSFLQENSFRLNFVPIAPDFIINCGGLSVAFIFVTNWDGVETKSIFCRVQKLKEQFANLYVVVTLPTQEQNDCFICSYFKYGMELGKPTFIPVKYLEMGMEKIVKIAHARGVCKRQDAVAKLKSEKEKSVQAMDAYLKVVSAIPGIDKHDANSLNQAIGSIEAIAKASKECILKNTDLSADKAEKISMFFKDLKYSLGPKIS